MRREFVYRKFLCVVIFSHGSGAFVFWSSETLKARGRMQQGAGMSPTAAEQGQAGNVPCPPSTPSSTGRYQRQFVAENTGFGNPSSCGNQGFQAGAPGVGVQNVGNLAGGMPSFPVDASRTDGLQAGNLASGFRTSPMMPMMPGCGGCFGTQSGSCTGVNMMGVPNPGVGQVGSDPSARGGFQPWQGGCCGCGSNVPGGMTQQASNVRQIVDLLQTLDSNQTRVLQQIVSERVGNQGRGLPEFFGDMPRDLTSEPFVPDGQGEMIGSGGSTHERASRLDVFSKSEKWLTSPPSVSVENWRSREQEVLGWNEYVSQLIAWAALASESFASEISHASRWQSVIAWNTLTSAQRSRSSRLFSILKAAFVNHPRTHMLISVFAEGMHLQEQVAGALHVGQANANGYELLRQLTVEFSLKSRGEALSLRTALAARSFSLSAAETSVGTVVSDTIRKIDYECARYSKLISTLPNTIDQTGLGIPEADMLLMLLRSLPTTVRDFCVHHASGETFGAYRQAAKRWEEQQRIFQEMTNLGGGSSRKQVSQVADVDVSMKGVEHYQMYDSSDWHSEYLVDSVSNEKCGKCGSRKHSSDSCKVDLTKVKCFKCQETGHVGMNCPRNRDGKSQQGKGKEKGKSKGVQKGFHFDKGKGKDKGKGADKGFGKKGKGKGFGKKGKLNEVGWSDEDYWWYSDDWNSYDWSWDVDQVGWSYNDWGTEEWHDNSPTKQVQFQEPSKPSESQDGSEGQKAQSVGSLIIHAITGAVSEQNGRLILESGTQSSGALERESSTLDLPSGPVMPEPLASGPCLSEPLVPGPQMSEPYGRELKPGTLDSGTLDVGRPVKYGSKCLKIFCGCEICTEEMRRFSEEWKRHRESSQEAEGDVGVGGHLPQGSDERLMLSDHGYTVCCCFGSVFRSAFLKDFSNCFPFCPLLSELNMETDSSWWLIDSGAAVTVVSESSFAQFQADVRSSPDVERFRAANGSKVSMKGVADIGLSFSMKSSDHKMVWKNATMQVMVGGTHHNILSTTALCRSGWTFTQWSDGAELRHDASGNVMGEVVMHTGCPWVRMYPVSSVASVGLPKRDDLLVDAPVVDREVGLSPLSPGVEAALDMHRRQGHFPHHPGCPDCARGRSVFRHRRKANNAIECEVQADFCYLTRRGELTEEDHGKNLKILVLTEMLSGCVAFIVVGESKPRVQSDVERWLDSFGLMSQQTSIVLHTDDEVGVGELVGRSSKHYLFQLRRAAPQQHRSIGGAERSVRKLKESLSVLRADLNKQGYDIRYSFEGVRDVVTYLALMNNHFGRVGGTNLSPLETSAGRELSKPVVVSFGAMVIAEIPDSIRQYSPNETRSIEAAYVHPGLGTGAAVVGLLRVEGRMTLRRFYARNIRDVSPLTWKPELCEPLLMPLDLGDAQVASSCW